MSKTLEGNLRIEALSEANIHHLVDLYQIVMNRKFSLDYVKRKFDTSYLGVRHFGHFAFDDDRPVAFHGAIPFECVHADKIELAAQYGDAMTLPSHQGRGLFTLLGKKTDTALQQQGVKFVFGFPNQNSEYGYVNKLNWTEANRINRYEFNINTLPVEAVKNKILGQKYQIKEPGKVIDSFSSILRTNNEKGVFVSRSNDFFKYKRFAGSQVVELNGVRVWLKIDHGLLIGDMEVCDQHTFDSVLKSLRKMALRKGLLKIHFQVSPITWLNQYLKKYQEPNQSWMLGYKNFSSQFPLENLVCSYGDLDTF